MSDSILCFLRLIMELCSHCKLRAELIIGFFVFPVLAVFSMTIPWITFGLAFFLAAMMPQWCCHSAN